jgi:predicted Zn-dependent protease
VDSTAASVAGHSVDAAYMVEAIADENGDDALMLRGEFGRIRMLQGRLGEADRLLAPVYRASDPKSPDFAKLVLHYADLLHRMHRDAEAIAVLDRIEAVLKMYPDGLDELAIGTAKLREAIVAGS